MPIFSLVDKIYTTITDSHTVSPSISLRMSPRKNFARAQLTSALNSVHGKCLPGH